MNGNNWGGMNGNNWGGMNGNNWGGMNGNNGGRVQTGTIPVGDKCRWETKCDGRALASCTLVWFEHIFI